MENLLISVIVPVYKVEPYLDRCVQSIVDQTYKDLEIILVDDGSPDNCPAMCDAWARLDDRIKVIHKENGGVSRARNTGLSIATGDFVIFIDSDDSLHTSFLEFLRKCQLQYHADITIAEKKQLNNTDILQDSFISYEDFPTCSLSLEEFFRLGMLKRWVTGVLISRRVVENARFESDIRLGEDSVFFYSLLKNNCSIALIKAKLYYYYMRNNSASAGHDGLSAFFFLGNWCVQNWESFPSKTRDYILIEGLKNLFIYRYEFRNDIDAVYMEENKKSIRIAVNALKRKTSVSFIRRLIFICMANHPFAYSVYVWAINRK